MILNLNHFLSFLFLCSFILYKSNPSMHKKSTYLKAKTKGHYYFATKTMKVVIGFCLKYGELECGLYEISQI